MKKAYEQPEVAELGPAEVLTMGAKGCQTDNDGCDMNKEAETF